MSRTIASIRVDHHRIGTQRATGDATVLKRSIGVIRSGATWLRAMLAERRRRLELGALSDRTLDDLGLVRADIDGELARPIWQSVDYRSLDERRRARRWRRRWRR